MTKYIVGIREVWVQLVEVEAKDKEDALAIVADAGGKYLDGVEYSHQLDSDTWTVDVPIEIE